MNDTNIKDILMTLRAVMTRITMKILSRSINPSDASILVNMLEAFEKDPKSCFAGIAAARHVPTLPPPRASITDPAITIPPIQEQGAEGVDSWETPGFKEAPSTAQPEKKEEQNSTAAKPPPRKITVERRPPPPAASDQIGYIVDEPRPVSRRK